MKYNLKLRQISFYVFLSTLKEYIIYSFINFLDALPKTVYLKNFNYLFIRVSKMYQNQLVFKFIFFYRLVRGHKQKLLISIFNLII